MKTFADRVLHSIPNYGLYLSVGNKDLSRALEMITHSELTPLQRKILIKKVKQSRECIELSEPKNY